MKTFISDIFPKLQRYSQRLENLTLLTNQHWVSIDDISDIKTVYIFRTNNDLLISKNGIVEKAKWEFLGNRSLLIDKENESFLFKHGFFDENILALKMDSTEEYAVFVNENKYRGELNTIERIHDFLNKTYSLVSTNPQIPENINTVFRDLIDGRKIKIIASNREIIGAFVFIDNEPAPDGEYVYKSMTHKLIAIDGQIVERYFLQKFNNFIFEKKGVGDPEIGDRVYLMNNQIPKNGKIKYSLFKSYYIENGIIVR